MKTIQQLFDVAYEGVISQGCLSEADGGGAYRSTDAKGRPIMCAIGHSLENYNHAFEGRNVADLSRNELRWAGLPIDKEVGLFMDELQLAHDTALTEPTETAEMATFKRNMHALAAKHGLIVPVL